MKEKKKPKEKRTEVKEKNSKKWIILPLAIVIVAAILFIAPSLNSEQKNAKSNESALGQQEQPNKTVQQKPEKSEEFTSGIIIIEVTPTPTVEATPVSKDRPIMLFLRAPQNVSQGETFTVDVLVDPRGNNISIAQFNILFASGIRPDAFEFGSALNPNDSMAVINQGNQGEISKISFLLVPNGETFPQTEFLAGTISIAAVSGGTQGMSFHKIDIVNEETSNIYTIGEYTTIDIQQLITTYSS